MSCALFVPASSERMLQSVHAAKAGAESADILILDLEDAVVPQAKEMARGNVALFLQQPNRPRTFIRINGLRSGLAADDLDAVMPFGPEGIVLPKTEGMADVEQLGVKLAVREAEQGLPDGSTRILPMVGETARSVFLLSDFAHRSSNRLFALAWGAEDLAMEIGARRNREPDGTFTAPFQMVRHTVLMAAAAAGIPAYDAVYPAFRDKIGLREEAERAARDGFSGKFAIHPAQITPIRESFAPTQAEIAEARSIIAAFSKEKTGAIAFEDRMLDRPHLLQAHRILERAGHVHS
jgi:citrate lyase subunit beta / citryl-CoA lyase